MNLSKSSPQKTESWSIKDSAQLYDLFRSKQIDPLQQTPKYIRTTWEAHSWIRKKYPVRPQPFYKTYRTHANIFISEEQLKGGRRKGNYNTMLRHSFDNILTLNCIFSFNYS